VNKSHQTRSVPNRTGFIPHGFPLPPTNASPSLTDALLDATGVSD
jgi:hypothetical protein